MTVGSSNSYGSFEEFLKRMQRPPAAPVLLKNGLPAALELSLLHNRGSLIEALRILIRMGVPFHEAVKVSQALAANLTTTVVATHAPPDAKPLLEKLGVRAEPHIPSSQ